MRGFALKMMGAALVVAVVSCENLRKDAPPVDFVTEVKPVLERRCLECHNRDYVFAGLRLETRELAMKGGRSGPVIIPGNPDDSLLHRVLLLGHENPVAMPPTPEGTFEEEKKVIRTWIAQGATWPDNTKLVPPQYWPQNR